MWTTTGMPRCIWRRPDDAWTEWTASTQRDPRDQPTCSTSDAQPATFSWRRPIVPGLLEESRFPSMHGLGH